MINLKTTALLTTLLGGILISSCSGSGSEKNTETAGEHSENMMHDHEHTNNPKTVGMEEDLNNPKTVVNSEISKEQAKKILDAYLEIKDALVATNGEKASAAAAKLVAIVKSLQGELAKKILFDAEHIEETKAASHQRDHFKTLSNNVFTIVSETKANTATLYKQYCPMAFDGKGGYWISEESAIKNPYFGDKMLTCGSTKETLPSEG